MMKRGICILLAKTRTHPTAIASVLLSVSAVPLCLFLRLTQTQPTHSSFGLMAHKVSPKCKTLRASAGHPTQPKKLEAFSFYKSFIVIISSKIRRKLL